MEAVGKYLDLFKGKCRIIYDVEAIVTDREILKAELNGSVIGKKRKVNGTKMR